MRASRPAFVLFLIGAMTACNASSEQSPPPTAPPTPAEAGPLPSVPDPVAVGGLVTDVATIVQSVQPQWDPGAGGLRMKDDWGEHPVLLEPPVPVSVLAGPVDVGGEDWYQVYVLPDPMRWPSDFAAWVPAEQDGARVVEVAEPAGCPVGGVAELARLTPIGRVECFGDLTLMFAARSWLAGHWVPYETEPAWLGTPIRGSRSVSLFEPGGGELPRPPDPRVPWIDARVSPEIEMPPAGVTALVEGQFDHRDARKCRRTRDRSGPPPRPPTAGLPDEGPDASDVWCRGSSSSPPGRSCSGRRGVRRPRVRSSSTARASMAACGGVGMPLLRFRMDLGEADPIWLEPVEGGPRSIPVFGAGFRAETEPELAVIGPRGEVVARDGMPLNPDEPFGPYAVCPMGDTLTITGS